MMMSHGNEKDQDDMETRYEHLCIVVVASGDTHAGTRWHTHDVTTHDRGASGVAPLARIRPHGTAP